MQLPTRSPGEAAALLWSHTASQNVNIATHTYSNTELGNHVNVDLGFRLYLGFIRL